MVPSPRKRAPRASFNQTWDDTDAALLDPSSLPVARIPRGWERKQETKRTGEGREKKIWRRINLRSRASDVAEEEDEEEHDARSRAVKRQQNMSPKAMEKTTSKLNGRKRAFKATRWDRRKSVLPSRTGPTLQHYGILTRLTGKKTSRQNPIAEDQDAAEESEDAQDATAEDLSYESYADADTILSPKVVIARDLPAECEKRRWTFTFSMETETSEAIEQDTAQQTGSEAPMEDATITRLFRSPAKNTTTQSLESSGQIQYPELPHSDNDAVEPTTMTDMDDDMFDAEEIKIHVEGGEGLATELEALTGILGQEEVDSAVAEAPVIQAADVPEVSGGIVYPTLPTEMTPTDEHKSPASPQLEGHIEPAAEDAGKDSDSEDIDMEDDLPTDGAVETSPDEEFTKESLQLHILRDCEESATAGTKNIERQANIEQVDNQELELMEESCDEESVQMHQEQMTEPQLRDITDGLTLSLTPAKVPSAEPTPRKLHSPPPPPMQSAQDDGTMTIALDDDTALLKDFLNRAAASKAKAEKAAVTTHRRESLQNRRDSDVIRHALASPRKALEEKDPNSPAKYDNELTLDLSQPLTLSMDNNALASPNTDPADDGEPADEKSSRGSRRSARTKKSLLPAPASAAQAPVQTSKIAIRRPDGTEHVVLKKSNAQEVSLLTRNNTRKNKQGAFCVTVRLMKLSIDSVNLPPLDESIREPVVGKNIRWDEQLAYYQENPEVVADLESLATPDELGMPEATSTPSAKPKNKVSKNSTPKIRRVRGLGTANGTPGKILRAPSLAEADDEEKETPSFPLLTAHQQQLPKPKSSKIKKLQISSTPTSTSTPSDSRLPTLEIAPVGVDPTKEHRKSRLAAPKKVVLPQPATSLPAEGKENNTQRTAIGGIGHATPKKGIPAPKVIVPPSVGVESGLPRRRGRKL
jgi:hypothetical protein